MSAVRVVVVDDHEIVRAGLSTLLSREPDIHLVGMAPDAEEGIEMIADVHPDVVVVDYSLPRMSGVELCEQIVSRFPETAVVVLTSYLSDEVILRSVQAGAQAFVYKDVDAAELKKAIRAVTRGETILDPKVAGRVVRWANTRGKRGRREGGLSLQETEVLRHVTVGATNKAIAEAMSVSENTIKTYLRRIMEKLDCHSRSEAAAIAAKRGLL
ncbi:MAG TPA: response regulator transcription factor [Acidimicrobiales bacterium]|nr:response regulator transcription factor [Acidimicrobiales bacterium]